MSDKLYQSVDVSHFRSALSKIHEQVAASHGRIEVTREGCDDVCVILSKAELQSLERALEIFAETAEYKAMCDNLSRLVLACGPVAVTGDLAHCE